MDPTSVHVSWIPPDPIGQTIGYQVYYTGPTSGNVSVDGVESNNQTVSGLVNGEMYYFSVAGRSQHFESELVPAQQNPVGLSKFHSPLPFLSEEQYIASTPSCATALNFCVSVCHCPHGTMAMV